jgi:iron complex outermembrane receptor protein
MKRRILLLSVALSAATPFAGAEEPGGAYGLGEITITAPAAVGTQLGGAVITQQEIQNFERDTLDTAIQLIPGATVSEVGARNETDVWLRGFDRWRVPLYIDGIPVYLPADDRIDFSRFATGDIAEIQVSKGFASVIDGPGAMGGSINLVSRQVTAPFQGDARLGAGFDGNGAFNGMIVDSFVGGRVDDWFMQGDVSERYQNHFRVSDSYPPGTFENGGDRNRSYSNDYKINLKAGFAPNDTDEYALNFIDQMGQKDNPLPDSVIPASVQSQVRYWTWPDWDKQSVYFLSRTAIDDQASAVKVRIYWDRFYNVLDSYDNNTFATQTRPYAFDSIYDDYAVGGSVTLDEVLLNGQDLFRAALHVRWDQHNAQEDTNAKVGLWYAQPWLSDDQMTYSAALENTYHPWTGWDVITGVSYDIRHLMQAQDFDSYQVVPANPPYGFVVNYPVTNKYAINPEAAVIYHYSDTGSVHASVAERARFPNLFELFSSRFGAYTGNPYLQPEKTINWEIGIADQVAGLHWGVNLFDSRIRDAIEGVGVVFPAPVGATTQERNVGTETHQGFEVTLSSHVLPEVELGGNYTYLERAIHTTGIVATDTPKHKLFVYANWTPLPSLLITPSVEYDSKKWLQGAIVTTYYYRGGDFVRADLKATYQLADNWSVDAGVRNLFDANYEVEDGYHAPGRNFFADMRARF